MSQVKEFGLVYYDNTTKEFIFYKLSNNYCINAVNVTDINDLISIIKCYINAGKIDWAKYNNNQDLVDSYNIKPTTCDVTGVNWMTITYDYVSINTYQIPLEYRVLINQYILSHPTLTITRLSLIDTHS